jgi:phytoene dehydrogenase-like protein
VVEEPADAAIHRADAGAGGERRERGVSADYDIIVLGAGPNGLAAAAYLAAAGKRVALIERGVETGGGLVTQELAGFRLNHHATYMLMAELLPPYRDLDLPARGVQFVRPDVQAAFLFDAPHSLILYTDPERTQASIEALSPPDGDRFRRMYDEFDEMCEAFLLPATYAPALPPLEQTVALSRTDELGERIAEISEMAPWEVVERYGFRDPRVHAAFLYLATMFGLEAEEGGIGFLVPIYVSRLMKAALVRGGSHQLASALRRAIEEHGGEVLTASPAEEILVEDGRAVGVRVSTRGKLTAEAIVSTLNPEQTFLDLIPRGGVEAELRESLGAWEWERTSLFLFNDGIVGEPPAYDGYSEDASRALFAVMGYDSPETVIDHQNEVTRGDRSRIAGHGSVPSLFDPLMVPAHIPFGPHHVLRWESWAPFDADWSRAATEAYQRECFDFWCHYAPNLKRANSRIRVVWTPRDIEAHLPTMKRGSIKHGAYTSLQMGYNRPVPECSAYRTPIDGLYVAGSSVHPGGMVLMGSGYNAARVVAEDLGVPLWEEPEMVRRARERGYLEDEEAP